MKELNTELLHFAEKAHKIMSEGTFPDYGVKINFKDSNNTITTNLVMTTEQKAKRYDEALEWMRKVYPTLTGAAKEDAEHYFPELKESENERIIRAIIDALYSHTNSINLLSSRGYQMEDIEAWLEKQKKSLHISESCKENANSFTDEDERIRKDVLAFIRCEGQHIDKYKWHKWIAWLKSLQPQLKPEQKPETKLTGWVARDSEHNSYFGLGLVLFRGKPRRTGDCWSGEIASHLPWNLFPDLKWEDEPVEVEVTIRKK